MPVRGFIYTANPTALYVYRPITKCVGASGLCLGQIVIVVRNLAADKQRGRVVHLLKEIPCLPSITKLSISHLAQFEIHYNISVYMIVCMIQKVFSLVTIVKITSISCRCCIARLYRAID